MKSLETSWDLLLAVAGLILFFIILFALIGLISFQGVFSRRCYYLTDDNSCKKSKKGLRFIYFNHDFLGELVEPALHCSGYVNGSSILGPRNVITGKTSYAGTHGYICTSGQMCLEDPANTPNYGFVSYDTIFHSLLSVYTFVSLELWTDLMYQTQEADSTVAALYYCLGVYIISFVLTFLLFGKIGCAFYLYKTDTFVAVITSAFARVRAESEVSAFTAKKKGFPVLRDAQGLNSDEIWLFDNPPDDLGKGVTRLKLRWWIVRLVQNRAFFYLGGLLVLLNLIFMCLRSFNASEERLELVGRSLKRWTIHSIDGSLFFFLLDNAETAFTFIFVIEILLRMVGSPSWMNFWVSKTNLIDLFLAICTCVIQLPMIQDSWVYKYLTIFQILRLYRLFLCMPRVRRLVVSLNLW